MQKFSVKNLEELRRTVAEIASGFSDRSIVLLKGPLGAGKTEFVKTFCALKGIKQVASPTFALHHHYENSDLNVEHLDLYRIEGEDELEGIGFWDLFTLDKAVIFIEWPEKMDTSNLPAYWDLFNIEIQVSTNSQGESLRTVLLTK